MKSAETLEINSLCENTIKVKKMSKYKCDISWWSHFVATSQISK